MKTWNDLKQSLPQLLAPEIETGESISYFKILAEHYHGQYNLDLTALELDLPAQLKIDFPDLVKRFKSHEPIQYVLGYTWFYNLKINVNPAVLIPRQETEELVHWILQDYQFKLGPTVWDIGTGSGCIALALAAYMRSPKIWASDVSERALATASANAQKNEIYNISFLEHNILQEPPPTHSYDIIVSNPPYIKPSAKSIMSKNVLQYEPELALFAPEEDPLVFYRAIARIAKSSLQPNGKLYFEINEFLKENLEELLQAEGFTSIEFKQDLSGLWRMVRCGIN
ncbi:MAG: peptide chain release factor N(5)-glutamine methyltransferase [Saprospiraceae bacterium]|nr:peptide chain release factor N(5)-glutamine methyltransferase [Saprospiraceae bacterium]